MEQETDTTMTITCSHRPAKKRLAFTSHAMPPTQSGCPKEKPNTRPGHCVVECSVFPSDNLTVHPVLPLTHTHTRRRSAPVTMTFRCARTWPNRGELHAMASCLASKAFVRTGGQANIGVGAFCKSSLVGPPLLAVARACDGSAERWRLGLVWSTLAQLGWVQVRSICRCHV